MRITIWTPCIVQHIVAKGCVEVSEKVNIGKEISCTGNCKESRCCKDNEGKWFTMPRAYQTLFVLHFTFLIQEVS